MVLLHEQTLLPPHNHPANLRTDCNVPARVGRDITLEIEELLDPPPMLSRPNPRRQKVTDSAHCPRTRETHLQFHETSGFKSCTSCAILR